MTVAEPLAATYVAERARAEELRMAIVRGLSGRNLPFVLDADPTSRFCVGVLTPPASGVRMKYFDESGRGASSEHPATAIQVANTMNLC